MHDYKKITLAIAENLSADPDKRPFAHAAASETVAELNRTAAGEIPFADLVAACMPLARVKSSLAILRAENRDFEKSTRYLSQHVAR